ncbi:MAG: cyclic nucleotide-binding domain-containing protein [Candidatus Hydrogenedentes bacterium]|nr:cyclic nucleotide-binding domain-containing protein [Candidatus Hydrogenedentota bacterium]
MGPDDIREAILNVPWVADFEPAIRETIVTAIKEVAEVRRLRKGHRMTREGSTGRNRGFILLTGSVRIHKSDMPDSKSKAPELLGEVMQFNPKKMRTATVMAHEDVLVLRFMWDEFWAALDRYLSEEDRVKVHESLEQRAWEHFTA